MALTVSELNPVIPANPAGLSGPADSPPRPVPIGVVAGLDVLASAWSGLGGPPVDGPAMVGARAQAAGLGRRGATSVGGEAHLVEAADGLVCLNLARPEDLVAIPALVGEALEPTDWPTVLRAVAGRTKAELVEVADLLGMPLGVPDTAPGPVLDRVRDACRCPGPGRRSVPLPTTPDGRRLE